MTNEDKERIEKDADALLLKYPADSALQEGRKKFYIAGATAEHERLQGQLNYANNNIHALTESRNNLAEQLKQVHNKVNFLVKALKEIQNIPETGAYEHKIIEEAFELSGITGLSESLKQ